MKTLKILFVILMAGVIETNAQIPNNGFENWTFDGSCYQPESWACVNDWLGLTENCYSMSRSDDHYPVSVGNYSIKVENNVSILPDAGAYGLIWTGDSTGFGTDQPVFKITGHPLSLCGYYKFQPVNGDTMDIHFMFYKNGVEVASGGMQSAVAAPAWTPFIIPVNNPGYPEADSGRILIATFNSDSQMIYGNSVLYADNLSFDQLISSIPEPPDRLSFSISPNPAHNEFEAHCSMVGITKDLHINIYNFVGQLVKSEKLFRNDQKVNIATLAPGAYQVTLFSDHPEVVCKLIIQK